MTTNVIRFCFIFSGFKQPAPDRNRWSVISEIWPNTPIRDILKSGHDAAVNKEASVGFVDADDNILGGAFRRNNLIQCARMNDDGIRVYTMKHKFQKDGWNGKTLTAEANAHKIA